MKFPSFPTLEVKSQKLLQQCLPQFTLFDKLICSSWFINDCYILTTR